MKVLIDTNIILDVLCNRSEFIEDSIKIFKLCEVKKITGYISSLSIPNIIYIMRKELDKNKVKEILEKLSIIFNIIDLKFDDLKKATILNIEDYEDAIQSAQASRIKANYIITRNVKDYNNSKISAIKPSELIDRL